MPPKKKGRGASKAASTPARASTRSEGPAVPATVTTNRGKEYETTAALARPRREAKPTVAIPVALAPLKKSTKTTAKAPATKEEVASPAVAKKRGRPAKAAPAVVEEPAKKRGRPAKGAPVAVDEGRPKRKAPPGRKAKATTEESEDENDEDEGDEEEGDVDEGAEEDEEPPAKRSRIAKVAEPPARKPGRPAKVTKKKPEPEEAPDALDVPAPRKRGRGPKGGATTKISTDDTDAADQLEDELVDATEHDIEDPQPDQKRKAPIATKKGQGKAAETAEQTTDAVEDGSTNKGYWLMKAEQVDREVPLKSGGIFNAKFTIDDLKAATAPEPWDGVRNMVARNNIRAMKAGDLAFFYASQSKGKLQPGITGIMEIVREHEPDQSVEDENHYGYIDAAKRKVENPWSVVHVEFRKKLSKPVTLKELQKFSGNGVLGNSEFLKQARVSVCKVSEKEWNFIVDNLIEGYEGEDENEMDAEDQAADAVDLPVTDDSPVINNAPALDNAVAPVAATTSRPASRAVSRQTSIAPPPIMESTEAIEETTTTVAVEMAIDSAAPTSRPASRAGSKKPASRAASKAASRAGSAKPASRAGSLKPASRAGSLAPPARPVSRGRSNTPKPLAAAGSAAHHMESVLEEDITAEQLDQMIE